MAIAIKRGLGLTPIWEAAEKAMGKIKAAAALLVIISVNTVVIKYIPANTPIGPRTLTVFIITPAIAPAAPLF